jgi:hypothetical protein
MIVPLWQWTIPQIIKDFSQLESSIFEWDFKRGPPRLMTPEGTHVICLTKVPVLTLRWGPSKSRTADVTIGNHLGIYKSLLLREHLV